MDTSRALAHHFADLRAQGHAARLGMWIFLATEVLLFGGLFVAYAFYRSAFPQSFAEASRHLNTTMGAVDTAILLTSSLFAVLALHFYRAGRNRMVVLLLAATMSMGVAFLVAHGFEYAHEYHEGALPGRYYHFAAVPLAGAPMFFTLYFLMTGLHSLHVLAGVGVLGWAAAQTARGRFVAGYDVPLEVTTLYWHLVDVIWIFLFPLLYLV